MYIAELCIFLICATTALISISIIGDLLDEPEPNSVTSLLLGVFMGIGAVSIFGMFIVSLAVMYAETV